VWVLVVGSENPIVFETFKIDRVDFLALVDDVVKHIWYGKFRSNADFPVIEIVAHSDFDSWDLNAVDRKLDGFGGVGAYDHNGILFGFLVGHNKKTMDIVPYKNDLIPKAMLPKHLVLRLMSVCPIL
jgi:S-adenosylmethionine synthetase